MSKTRIYREGSFLERDGNRFEYCGSGTSAYIDFDCSGARSIIDFFRKTRKINGEEIKCFNFSSNVVENVIGDMYGCNDINITMRELREKYNITSNYVFCEDIRNLIFLLEGSLYDENRKEIVDVVGKIKQIIRDNTNGKQKS